MSLLSARGLQNFNRQAAEPFGTSYNSMGQNIDNAKIRKTIAAFQSAPFHANGWDIALKHFASITGSSHAQLLAAGDDGPYFNWTTDMDDTFTDDFVKIQGHLPHMNYRLAATGSPFELMWEAHYDEVRRKGSYDLYMDSVRRWDMEHGVHTLLTKKDNSLYGLVALHGEKDGRTTEDQRAAFQTISTHVLAAIQLQKSIEHKGADLLRGSFEALHQAIIVLDGRGKVCVVTDAAQSLLGPTTFQIRNEMLRCMRSELEMGFQARIKAALAGKAPVPNEIWLHTRDGPLRVEICALPEQEWSMRFAPKLIITLHTLSPPCSDQGKRLSSVLGLTHAEGEVVALLTQGHNRYKIAELRKVSVQTVTSQLRTIFLKTHVNREAELVTIARGIIEMASR